MMALMKHERVEFNQVFVVAVLFVWKLGKIAYVLWLLKSNIISLGLLRARLLILKSRTKIKIASAKDEEIRVSHPNTVVTQI